MSIPADRKKWLSIKTIGNVVHVSQIDDPTKKGITDAFWGEASRFTNNVKGGFNGAYNAVKNGGEKIVDAVWRNQTPGAEIPALNNATDEEIKPTANELINQMLDLQQRVFDIEKQVKGGTYDGLVSEVNEGILKKVDELKKKVLATGERTEDAKGYAKSIEETLQSALDMQKTNFEAKAGVEFVKAVNTLEKIKEDFEKSSAEIKEAVENTENGRKNETLFKIVTKMNTMVKQAEAARRVIDEKQMKDSGDRLMLKEYDAEAKGKLAFILTQRDSNMNRINSSIVNGDAQQQTERGNEHPTTRSVKKSDPFDSIVINEEEVAELEKLEREIESDDDTGSRLQTPPPVPTTDLPTDTTSNTPINGQVTGKSSSALKNLNANHLERNELQDIENEASYRVVNVFEESPQNAEKMESNIIYWRTQQLILEKRNKNFEGENIPKNNLLGVEYNEDIDKQKAKGLTKGVIRDDNTPITGFEIDYDVEAAFFRTKNFFELAKKNLDRNPSALKRIEILKKLKPENDEWASDRHVYNVLLCLLSTEFDFENGAEEEGEEEEEEEEQS